MQAVWITRRPTEPSSTGLRKGVLVFAAGWAGSDELVRHLPVPQGWDLLCLFDYRTLPDPAETERLLALLTPYGERHLVAWSFGVWAAATLFGAPGALRWDTATAIGGTPVPIDDAYGIPVRAFAVTVRSIGAAGTTRFLERMCGTPEILRAYCRHRSTRPLAEICDELAALQRQALAGTSDRTEPVKGFWTRAVVGGQDAIFPPEHMERYWHEAGVPVTMRPEMPHYPLYEPDILVRCLSDEIR